MSTLLILLIGIIILSIALAGLMTTGLWAIIVVMINTEIKRMLKKDEEVKNEKAG